MKNLENMIIIPDTHGRTFWKEAVSKREPEEEVVFLGDYLDPYIGEVDELTREKITKTSALENLEEILSYKENNPSTTKLLIGNHDAEYFLGTTPSRQDYVRFKEIGENFLNSLDLFDLGYYKKTPKLTYTFSHTGITESWVKRNFGKNVEILQAINLVNSLLHGSQEDRDQLREILDQIGWARGGTYDNGSMIWADVYEIPNNEWPGILQIIGHSQQYEYPIHEYSFSMLDCRKAFRLQENLETIEPLNKNLDNYKAYAREETPI